MFYVWRTSHRICSLVLLSAVALELSGCAAGGSPYHPRSTENDVGFSDLQLENNRFSVSFRGDRHLSQQELEGFLLYRAAQITRARGKDYFIARNIRVSCEQGFSDYHPYRSVYANGYYHSISPGPLYHHVRCEARTDILLFSGEKPRQELSSYQAEDLIQHLEQNLPGLLAD